MRNYELIKQNLLTFLNKSLEQTGAKNLLVGVSGGLDSAVVVTLCKLANPNTYALLMPTINSDIKNLNDGINLCKNLNINFKIINIDKILSSYENSISEKLNKLRYGNLSARVRMSLLYDYSASIDAIVVGTSNKSELMLGYGTIFGDLACAINPIGELYKSEIFEFAKTLGIDANIINKAPTADLWQGQSDEADLGYSYEKLDSVLKFIEENGENIQILYENFNDKKLVDTVTSRLRKNKFKRHMPIIAAL
ncbi:MAG: NAD+ synthase [Campylobacter sp.]|nr:NAD+ synthase [Campylobacter sp.]